MTKQPGWLSQFLLRRRRKRPGVVVLGTEAAAAEAAENERLKGPTGPSPMPPRGYGTRQLDLWRVEADPLDGEIAAVGRRLATLDDTSRAAARRSISMDEFYTLLGFARRMAVFALRERNPELLRDALRGVALIEIERVDYRDVPLTLSVLSHAAWRIECDVAGLFDEAAAIAQPAGAEFIRAAAKPHDLGPAAGYQEITTASGPGFVRCGFDPYEPTYDLARLAVDLVAVPEADRYDVRSIEVASTLPAIWLEPARDPRLERVLGNIRAGAVVSGSLRAASGDWTHAHHLWFWIQQTQETRDAETLRDIAERTEPKTFCVVGLAQENLFCLIVATSGVADVKTIETRESLRRFAPGVAALLASAAQRP